MKTHKDPDVYKSIRLLICEIYKKTSAFPQAELFGLTSQLRRAGVSIDTKYSEGAGRLSSKEFLGFLRISYGSVAELATLVTVAMDIGYLPPESGNSIHKKIILITVQLGNLMKAIQRRINIPA